MNDEAGFLADIRANPHDIMSRLIYADWLEERGDPRAEYLRLICEIPEGEDPQREAFHRQNGGPRITAEELEFRCRLTTLAEEFTHEWEAAVCRPYAVLLTAVERPKRIQTIINVRKLTSLNLTCTARVIGGVGTSERLQPNRRLPRIVRQCLTFERAQYFVSQIERAQGKAMVISPDLPPKGSQ